MYGVRIHCSRKAIAAGNNQKREESWKNESLLYLRRDGGGDVQEKIDFLTLLSLTQRSLRPRRLPPRRSRQFPPSNSADIAEPGLIS